MKIATRNGVRKTAGGWKFKAAIQDRGWSQAQAAVELSKSEKRLAFTPQYISKLVNNREAPGRRRAQVIERVLGVPMSAW